jgi:5-methylcytosine-specific restriction endonuclease McrA
MIGNGCPFLVGVYDLAMHGENGVEKKRANALSQTLISKFRKFPSYRQWSKNDFIRCQCEHEGIKQPSRNDQEERFAVLARFATRLGLVVPEKTMKEQRQVKHGRPEHKRVKVYSENDVVFTEWRLARYEALRRSRGCCECCGATPKTSGKPLHVDHIKPKSIYPELEYVVSNLQVLCADCNIGKGNWDESNWRDNKAGSDDPLSDESIAEAIVKH